MKNKITESFLKIFIGSLTLQVVLAVSFFAGIHNAYAENVVARCDSATLTGDVAPNGYPTEVWFIWGPNTSMQYSTSRQTFTNDSNFEAHISPLNQNTTYYYQAMARNEAGTGRGSVLSFRTPACKNTTPTAQRPSVDLNADQSSVNHGQSTSIRWNVSNNPSSCTASGGANGWSGNRSTSGGSFNTGSLTSTTTYSLTCNNSAGSDTDSVTVQVNRETSVFVSLYADQNPIISGTGTTIRWDVLNATSCTASGGANGWSGNRSTSSGAFNTGALTATTSFSMTCSNSSGSSSAQVIVQVTPVQTNNNNNNANTPGQTPLVVLIVDDLSINEGEDTTIRWNISGTAISCTASGGTNGWSGNRNTSGGSFNTGSLFATTTYSMTCINPSGSNTNSITVHVDQDDNDNNNNDNDEEPDVNTRSANDITEDRATLRGHVDGNGSSTRVWFEYGTERGDLDEETSERSKGSGSTNFEARITGLEENETYYFRAVAENDEGTERGSILSFRTDNIDNDDDDNDDEPDVETNSANNIDTNSATLRGHVDGNGSSTRVWFQWSFDRNNLSGRTSENSSGAGRDDFSHTISNLASNRTYYFRAVAENDEGRVYGSVRSFTTRSSGTTFTPTTTTTTTTRSTTNDDSGVDLATNIFDANFFPDNIFGWLLLLILILLVILLARYLYGDDRRQAQPEPIHTTPTH